jgi:hypothetical protein
MNFNKRTFHGGSIKQQYREVTGILRAPKERWCKKASNSCPISPKEG